MAGDVFSFVWREAKDTPGRRNPSHLTKEQVPHVLSVDDVYNQDLYVSALAKVDFPQ